MPEEEEGTISGLPPIPEPQKTDDSHADFHQRSTLPWGSALCYRCTGEEAR